MQTLPLYLGGFGKLSICVTILNFIFFGGVQNGCRMGAEGKRKMSGRVTEGKRKVGVSDQNFKSTK